MLSKNLLSKSGMLQSAFALQEVAMTTQDRAFARKCHDEGFGSQKSSEDNPNSRRLAPGGPDLTQSRPIYSS